MKRKASLLAFFLLLFTNISFSQPWHYDFPDTIKSISSSSSLTFLPSPPSGTSRVRVGSGGGIISVQKSPEIFDVTSYLRMAAPTGGSVNKFAVYNYTPGKIFTLKFSLRLGASDGSILNTANGNWYLFAGDGNTYLNDAAFSGGECFLGIQFIFGNSGAITTNIRVNASWVQLGSLSSPFQQGTNYIVEIYGNNSSQSQNYLYNGPQSVAANKWDIYVNGVLAGDELGKAALPGNTNIDSWMFYGESSSGNAANIFIDNIDFTNTISENPLPVDLSSFVVTAMGRNVMLNWSTSAEVNNSGFEIERCSQSGGPENFWESIGFVKGSGTVNTSKEYTFEDRGLKAGTYRYRLKQIDFNGNFEYFEPQNTDEAVIFKPLEFTLLQNYPNPSNPTSNIDFDMPFDGIVSLRVYDVSGKEVAVLANGFHTANFYTILFDGSNLPSGVYFYRLTAEGKTERFTKTLKMILVK